MWVFPEQNGMRNILIFTFCFIGLINVQFAQQGGDSQALHSWIEGLYPEREFPLLQDLLDSLETTSTPTLIDRLRIEEDRDGVVVARSRRLPDVFADIQLNVTAEDREDFEDLVWRSRPFNRVSLRQPLYHWSALKAGEKAAELELENAHLRYEQNLRNRKQQLRDAFFQLLEREYALQLARQRTELANNNLESVQLSVELGKASQSDLLRSNYRVQNDEGRVLFEIQALEHIRYRIFEQTGIRIREIPNLEQIVSQMLSLDFRDFEFQNQPISLVDEEGLILENRIEQAQKDYVIQQSRNKPKVNLLLSAFQDEIGIRGNEDSITRNNLFIGFQVDWHIWDSGEGRARSRIALNRKTQLERALELSSENLKEEFRFLLDRLQQMVELLQARQVQIQAMEQLLQQRRVEMEQGRAIQDQLLDDQIDLDNTKLLYLRSVSDYFLTLAQIADLLDSPELDDPDLQ